MRAYFDASYLALLGSQVSYPNYWKLLCSEKPFLPTRNIFGNLILMGCWKCQDWTSAFPFILHLLYSQNYTPLACLYRNLPNTKRKQTKTLVTLFQAPWSQSRFNLHWSMVTADLNSKFYILISKNGMENGLKTLPPNNSQFLLTLLIPTTKFLHVTRPRFNL